ncbi:hypothetical protein D3C81_2133440 [compost metagenome]
MDVTLQVSTLMQNPVSPFSLLLELLRSLTAYGSGRLEDTGSPLENAASNAPSRSFHSEIAEAAEPKVRTAFSSKMW